MPSNTSLWGDEYGGSLQAYYKFRKLQIPVSLYTVIQDNSIHFNQLHKETKGRILNKKTCTNFDGEIKSEDIIKGYQYNKDRYVIITNEELESIKMEKDKSIQIISFTDLSNINPIYFDKTYHAIPDIGSEKAFELLRVAMLDERKVAIAKTIMGTKETLIAIIPTETEVMINLLYYVDEV